MKKLSLKFILSLGGLMAIYWSNGGIENSYINLVQSLILICGWWILIWWSKGEKHVLRFSLLMFAGMIILYVLGISEWSGYLGSVGMGLIFLYVLIKIPQFVKQGYLTQ